MSRERILAAAFGAAAIGTGGGSVFQHGPNGAALGGVALVFALLCVAMAVREYQGNGSGGEH
jgi:DMSO reductase anchor subunit